MCGINGFTWRDEELIGRMNTALRHRGPDDEGVYVDDRVSLGHTRLSILDLSPAGHQPMRRARRDGKGELWLTYNGEIYNFRDVRTELEALGHTFASQSDSEVIPAAYEAWGADCVQRFNGMWAFALYDVNAATIFLSRDRFGKKPLYYHRDGGRLVFSSEIKAILEHGIARRVNETVLWNYLYFDMINYGPETFFQDVRLLPPGHNAFLNLSDGSFELQSFYSIPLPTETPATPERVRAELEAAVQLRLVSDVPVSISLSGGVDSTAIAACMGPGDDYAAFSTASGKPGQGDETELVRLLLERYPDFVLHENRLAPGDFVERYRDVLYYMDEPFVGYSPFVRFQISRGVRATGRKVLLVGEGADEILGGYHGAAAYYLRDLLMGLRPLRFLRELRATFKQPEGRLILRNFLFHLLPRFVKRRVLLRRARADRGRWGLRGAPEPALRLKMLDARSLKQHLHTITASGSVPYLLNCNDRMGMANSVETRAPFMDYRFVGRAFALPTVDMVRDAFRKVPLRDAMRGLVPDEILYRRKKEAFFAPMNDYLRGPEMQARYRELFADARSARYLDPAKFLAEYEAFVAGATEDSSWLLKGLWLEEWLRMWEVA